MLSGRDHVRRLRALGGPLWARRHDAVTLSGVGLVAFGVAEIYQPAGIVTAGLAVITWGLLGAWTSRRKPK